MRKNNSGFTVIELIVSIALLAVILVPVAGFFTNSFRIQGRTSMRSSITRVGQYIIENFKNKNYLGLEVEDYIKDKKISDFNFEGGNTINLTGEDGWELNYNNSKYNVDIKLMGLTEANVYNVDIPETFDGRVNMDDQGILTSSNVDIYNIGNTFHYKIGEVTYGPYKAEYPTVVLNSYNGDSDDIVSLWLTNEGYSPSGYDLHIIKGFPNELQVYVEGTDIQIKKGIDGDGAPAKYKKITSIYMGGINETTNESTSELLFDAIMTITDAKDDTIKDSFEFSFPVNYGFIKEGD